MTLRPLQNTKRRTRRLIGSAGTVLLLLSGAGAAHPSSANQQHLGLPKSGQDGTRTMPSLSLRPWRNLTVTPGDSLSRLFQRAGLPGSQWSAVLALGGPVAALKQLRPGDVLHLRKTMGGKLLALRFRVGPLDTLNVVRTDDGLHAKLTHRKPRVRQARITGRVRHSLSGALASAGASPALAARVEHIFRWRADLSRDLRAGDRFAVVYEQRFIDGRRLPDGPVIAASLTVDGDEMRAFRRTDSDGDAHYYDARGRAFQPKIERAPLAYTHVSSPFSLHRMNPVLHVIRPHYGVDLAAPVGTPVRAAADGVVRMRAADGGYGRLIELEHSNGYETRYAHLSAFAAGLHRGDHVHQDQLIGFVGDSGVTTGPHLHYEIRHNGTPHDPMHMDLPNGSRLTGTSLTRFSQRIVPLLARLDGTGQPPLRTEVATAGSGGACSTDPPNTALAATMRGDADAFLAQLLCTPDVR